LGDELRSPWVTEAGLDRSGHAIVDWIAGWVRSRTEPPPRSSLLDLIGSVTDTDPQGLFTELSADRTPEFPTVSDDYVEEARPHEAARAAAAGSEAARTLAFTLVGLAGLVGVCAAYPAIVLWILSLAGDGALTFAPVTVGVAAILSLVVALMADCVLAGRVTLVLIAVMPLVIGPLVAVIAAADG
jgi:hypothetical protein